MTSGNRLTAALWLVAGLLALAVAAVALTRLPALSDLPTAERAPLEPGCDPRAGPCTVRFAGGGSVTLDITPRGIPSVTPLAVRARLAGLPTPRLVEIDFVGVDMDMGFNRAPLTPAGADAWQGKAMLPVCVRARMTWEARVLIHLPSGLLLAPFRFDTERI